MKTKFSKTWIRSKQGRKQRKYVANAPLNLKRKLLRSRLSKELSKKYNKRNFGIRTGDVVKIVRGNFKDHSGKIEKILTKKLKVFVEGINLVKKDGNKVPYSIHPSNLIVTELNLDDKLRKKRLMGEEKNEQKTSKSN